MMKKYFIIFLFIISSVFISAQEIIDQRAATVNLIRPEIISRKQLNQTVELLKQNGINKSDQEILETMIGDVLLKQGADREKIKATDAEVLNAIRKQIGPSASGMTDQQLKDIVRREFASVFCS